MRYSKVVLRLALVLNFALAPYAAAIGQDQKNRQDPSEKQRNVKPELKKAYKDWLDKDVTYIITDEERKAFKKLATDDERERFIEEFWRRRDPDPDTEENEFKEEYYERIAYANPTSERHTRWVARTKDRRGKVVAQPQPIRLRSGSIDIFLV
jgi:GWxTD domain-containing protein